MMRDGVRVARWMQAGLGLLALTVLVACKPQGGAPAPNTGPTVVNVMAVTVTQIKDVVELDGVVAPLQQVNLVARVAGSLDKIHFKDGDWVRKGDILFTIERASYVEQVHLNQAKLDQSRSDYDRQVQLLKENATSQASVDSSLSNLQQAEASVRLAKINLDYTEIRAPFDGVMGRRMVDAGNYVGATPGGTILATIMEISPAYVNAAVGEREALRLRGMLAAQGRTASSGVGNAQVHAQLQGELGGSETGVLDFVDHQVVAASGTVAIRGRFANTSHRLIPGFYAKLSIDLGAERRAVVLPRSLMQNDQQGEFVYVVGADNIARRRTVKTALLPGESKEILSGLQSGEQVVTNGYAKLADGQAVEIKASSKPGSAS